jgi:hypothetical protein
MAYEPSWTRLEELFTFTTILDSSIILPAIIAIIIMVVITRDTEKWKTLLLPVLALQGAMGIKVDVLLYIIALIMFAIEIGAVRLTSGIIQGYKKASEYRPSRREEKRLARTVEQGRMSIGLRQMAERMAGSGILNKAERRELERQIKEPEYRGEI